MATNSASSNAPQGTVVAIGDLRRIGGFALAGVSVCGAEDDVAAVSAWAALSSDVTLVILTPEADAAIARAEKTPGSVARYGADGIGLPLTVVIPS